MGHLSKFYMLYVYLEKIGEKNSFLRGKKYWIGLTGALVVKIWVMGHLTTDFTMLYVNLKMIGHGW